MRIIFLFKQCIKVVCDISNVVCTCNCYNRYISKKMSQGTFSEQNELAQTCEGGGGIGRVNDFPWLNENVTNFGNYCFV